MAQGSLLHPQLMLAFERFSTAQQAMSEAVSASQDQATEAFLTRARTDPSLVVEYNLRNNQRSARHLSRSLRGWTIDRNGVLQGIDAASFAASVNSYQAGVAALANAMAQNPSQSNAVRGLPLYQARSAAYLVHLQRLSVRLQNSEPFTAFDRRTLRTRTAWVVQGSPDAVNHAYNDVVQAYNLLR